jgi:RNA polymerase sigma-70 factor (ECF subfamily)
MKAEFNESMADDELILAFQQTGDHKAFEVLILKHHVYLYNFCHKLTSDRNLIEDLMQETHLKVLLKVGTYKNDYRFTTWMCAIARNVFVDYCRKRKLIVVSLDDDLIHPDILKFERSNSYDTEAMLMEKELNSYFLALLDTFNDSRMKEIMVFRYIDGLLYREICEKMKININTLKTIIRRANIHIKPKLRAIG